MSNNYLVIMAGGVGSRFWPISTEREPKQFLDILGCGRTLLQLTVDRFKDIIDKDKVWVVTVEQYRDTVHSQLPEVPEENIICEPCRRNTAPAICYASWKIKKRNPKANVVVTPADHFIPDARAFAAVVEDGLGFAAETDAIVTIGIRPTRPETGYGYIKANLGCASSRRDNIYRVDEFKEKPDLALAEQYVKDPNYLWNSGIFIWNVSTVVNAFRVYEPEISSIFEDMLPVYDTPEEKAAVHEGYAECPNISVDYAIMEKSEEVFVCPADFAWSDLGTWFSLREQMPKDKYGNVCVGENLSVYDTYHTVVHTTGLRRVVVQGLDGYVVAERDGELLICKLSEEQRIKLFH